MSERDLAEAIHHAFRDERTVDEAISLWRDMPHLHQRERFAALLPPLAQYVIDVVLARRQREAARTGPWGEERPVGAAAAVDPTDGGTPQAEPTSEEIIDALRERVAHLEIHRGRGRIADRIHELECMRAAISALEPARTGPWPKRSAKLTNQQVLEIRISTARGVDLARRYDISPATISLIRRGRIWKSLAKRTP